MNFKQIEIPVPDLPFPDPIDFKAGVLRSKGRIASGLLHAKAGILRAGANILSQKANALDKVAQAIPAVKAGLINTLKGFGGDKGGLGGLNPFGGGGGGGGYAAPQKPSYGPSNNQPQTYNAPQQQTYNAPQSGYGSPQGPVINSNSGRPQGPVINSNSGQIPGVNINVIPTSNTNSNNFVNNRPEKQQSNNNLFNVGTGLSFGNNQNQQSQYGNQNQQQQYGNQNNNNQQQQFQNNNNQQQQFNNQNNFQNQVQANNNYGVNQNQVRPVNNVFSNNQQQQVNNNNQDNYGSPVGNPIGPSNNNNAQQNSNPIQFNNNNNQQQNINNYASSLTSSNSNSNQFQPSINLPVQNNAVTNIDPNPVRLTFVNNDLAGQPNPFLSTPEKLILQESRQQQVRIFRK